jgi:hypothetical protein
MVKQRDLLKELRRIAAAKDGDLRLIRTTGDHDIYRIGDGQNLPIPRHREIGENLARTIIEAATRSTP